jgi:hypothetical protein
MAKPLTSDEREAIAEALRKGCSVREVAAMTGRSHGSVGNVAGEFGIDLGRPEVKRATDARVARIRELNTANAMGLAEDVERLRAGLFVVKANEPSAHAKAQTMIAIGIAMQRSMEAIAGEAPGLDESKGLIRDLADAARKWAASE